MTSGPHRAGAEDDLVSIVARAPVVTEAAAIASGAPSLVWLEPNGDDGWSFVGWGDAARVDGEGARRFEEIAASAERLFARVRDEGRELDAPSLRMFGGFAFDGAARRSEPWSSFAGASFTLPSVLYARRGAEAFLRVTAARDASASDLLRRAIERLEGSSANEGPSRRETGSLVDDGGEEAWRARVEAALRRMHEREVAKIVASMRARVAVPGGVDVARALAKLRADYRECFTFAFARERDTFFGASPELLVARAGRCARSEALAGTTPRRGDDATAILELLASAKERREHDHVVSAIRGSLAPFARSIDLDLEPRVRTLKNVHHLATEVRVDLAGGAHVLELAKALHPTPAVCGAPRDLAMAFIRENEPPRGWYAGAVGWFDAAGDGTFSVGIRSALARERDAWAFAGAGIVEGSSAAREWAETRAKLAPVLTALGVA